MPTPLFPQGFFLYLCYSVVSTQETRMFEFLWFIVGVLVGSIVVGVICALGSDQW